MPNQNDILIYEHSMLESKVNKFQNLMVFIRWAPGIYIPFIGRTGFKKSMMVLYYISEVIFEVKDYELQCFGPLARIYKKKEK